MFVGTKDNLCDLNWIRSEAGAADIIECANYEHLDFLVLNSVREKVFPIIKEKLERFA